jgi:hypothetical protein
MTFDQALTALLALVGRRLEVSVFDAGETPHLIASFKGRLRGAYSMTGGEPSPGEAIFVRFKSGGDTNSLSLDRELFAGAHQHPDGALSLRLGASEVIITPREDR